MNHLNNPVCASPQNFLKKVDATTDKEEEEDKETSTELREVRVLLRQANLNCQIQLGLHE